MQLVRLTTVVAAALILSGCPRALDSAHERSPVPATSPASTSAQPASFSLPDAALPNPLVFITYGDMRFTHVGEVNASLPMVRQALVAKVAAENPAAVFLNGDLPWHGVAEDYAVYVHETEVWRERGLRVYPALGNHEFSQCTEAECLERWWTTFPELRGRRWYSVALGSKVLGVALDSESSLLAGSEQRAWLQGLVQHLGNGVRVLLIVMHHPPVADIQTETLTSHNPRPNEIALAEYLGTLAPTLKAKILVSAAHLHNYERFLQSGVTYLVSGGGGAHPYEVERTAADLYQDKDFPNFHYVRFELHTDRLEAEMIRLSDSSAAAPSHWEIRDRFTLALPP